MLDNNDGANVVINNKTISTETMISNSNLVDTFYTFQEVNNFNKQVGKVVLSSNTFKKADELYVGRWSFFHNILWDINPNRQKFGDSGFILKWNNITLLAGDTVILGSYFGLPTLGKLKAIPNDLNVKTAETVILYPKKGAYKLTKTQKTSIDSLFHTDNYKGAVIEAYADAQGDSTFNQELSVKRATHVANYLISLGMEQSYIIKKPLGETFADTSMVYQNEGYIKDRKVKIKLMSFE